MANEEIEKIICDLDSLINSWEFRVESDEFECTHKKKRTRVMGGGEDIYVIP